MSNANIDTTQEKTTYRAQFKQFMMEVLGMESADAEEELNLWDETDDLDVDAFVALIG